MSIKMATMAARVYSILLFACSLMTVQGNVALNYTVTEEQQAGEFVANIRADSELRTSLTQEEFTSLRFSLLPQRNPHFRLFSVDERTGVLVTSAKLDRESICGRSLICLVKMSIATLATVTDFFRVFNVSVLITDINDNYPVFPNTNMRVTFSESAKIGDSFQIQEAIDQDAGINSEISYELQGSDGTFGLQYDTTRKAKADLRIVVNRLLDHERSQQQQMTLVARDKGSPPKVATASITISISDINDHAPVFTDAVYKLPVLENTPVQTLLLQVSARDLDQGVNGQVSYRFPTLTPQSTTDIFFLNSSTGELVLQKLLDFENNPLHEFQVEARDGGSPSRAAQTTVIVNVLDVNDNAPAITFNLPPGRQTIGVLESLAPGDFITQMSVFDADSGRDGEVSCQLAGNRFRLVHIFGSEFKILLNSSLDRESEAVVNITVTCTDHGASPKQDIQLLSIQVEDVNDNIPEFSQQFYDAEVEENPTNGDVIMKVSAADLDFGENGRVTFKINATGAQYFQVLTNGDIIVSSKLDREHTPEVVFDVIAMDSSQPFHSSTATVSIKVLDVNDEKPDFGPSEIVLSLQENLPEGTVVGTLNATDRDSGLGGEVTYSLATGVDIPFSIHGTNGSLQTTKNLDREETDSYQFTVLAMDRGTPQQTGSIRVTVKVADVNDNQPKFNFPNDINNTILIYNSLKVGEVVAMITASDNDQKNNSKVEYLFKDNAFPNSFFNLDAHTGIITLAKPFGRQAKRTLEVVVVARDQGEKAQSTEMRLFIIVNKDERPIPMLDGLAGRTNLTIAICILAVSAIVSGTIVIIICLVRRRQAKNTETPTKPDKGQAPPDDKNWNSLYDTKKTNSADIIITRERTPQNLQSVPSQYERDDRLLYKARDPTNPTFQVFPAEDHIHTPKMGYTEEMLVKSDGQSNSSTGDSGRGHSQDDIQWVHQPEYDAQHSLEDERFSQSSARSHDTRGSELLGHDYPWHADHHNMSSHSGQPSPAGHMSHSTHASYMGHPSPSGHHSRPGYPIGNGRSSMRGSSYS